MDLPCYDLSLFQSHHQAVQEYLMLFSNPLPFHFEQSILLPVHMILLTHSGENTNHKYAVLP